MNTNEHEEYRHSSIRVYSCVFVVDKFKKLKGKLTCLISSPSLFCYVDSGM